MKTTAILYLLFLVIPLFSQEITCTKIDTVSKTKERIYLDSKRFISDYWKSTPAVVDYDSEEDGIIVIKALSKHQVSITMQTLTYWFAYKLTIEIKEGRYRVKISNVWCERTTTTGDYELVRPPINEYTTPMKMNIPRKKYWNMMEELTEYIEDVCEEVNNYLQLPSVVDEEW